MLTARAPASILDQPATQHGQNGNNQNVNPGATPELGSLVLFGSGLLALAGGYGLSQRRAHRNDV
jgi:hypothetical protein